MEGEPMTYSSMLYSLGGVAHPRRFQDSTPGVRPENKGMLYPADPPTVEEIVCVMRSASEDFMVGGYGR